MEADNFTSVKTESSTAILEHVAHDFRGILQQISGLNSILHHKLTNTNEEINTLFEYIQQACSQGNSISNDLLIACELETYTRIPFEILSLNKIIDEQTNVYHLHANNKQINLHLRLSGRQFFFEVNRSKFIRALDNLFFNALKFTPKGGCIDLSLSDAGGKALIEIKDSGTGIPVELQPEIFKKYSKARYFEQNSEPHTGLGLYIVKKVVELHRGQVWYTTGDSGTSFFIELKSGIIL